MPALVGARHIVHVSRIWVKQGMSQQIKKKAKPERPIEIVIIIRPNCLTVDKAIIILKSYSKLAPRPAINIVKPEINNKKIFNHIPKEGLKRISK